MFLFIAFYILSSLNLPSIQIHLMFLFIDNSTGGKSGMHDSNTSHVLIYPSALSYQLNYNSGFKYISCSYLSVKTGHGRRYDYKFKYISCSYLSIYGKLWHRLYNDSNTSHVLIYPSSSQPFFMVSAHSNTSHVLIYPKLYSITLLDIIRFKYISCSYLSLAGAAVGGSDFIFKYISCSYLSLFGIHSPSAVMAFKYISCSYLSLVVKTIDCKGFAFKYISCSYLSSMLLLLVNFISNSNTSHVLIYPKVYFLDTQVSNLFKYISCSYLSRHPEGH